MNIVGEGRRVRIYTGESEQWGRKQLFLAVLELTRDGEIEKRLKEAYWYRE